MHALTSFHIAAELTNRCDFNCLHCFRTNNIAANPDLPVELYEKFLHQSRSYGAHCVNLTGGEPALHHDFGTILDVTAHYKYSYTLVTNGWQFQRLYPLLLQYRQGLEYLVLSLDGAQASTHDAIRQQPGSYQKVIEACITCHYKKIPFRLTMIVHRKNIAELRDFLELAAKLGAEEAYVGAAQLTPKLVSQNLALSPKARKLLGAKMLKLVSTAPLPLNPGFDFFIENPCVPCFTMRMSLLLIDYAGRLRFCCQLSGYPADAAHQNADIIGDLRDTSVWECHRRLVRKIADFQQEKITRIEQHTLTENDHFPCYYCMKYFGKLGWLRDFPDSEWNEDAT